MHGFIDFNDTAVRSLTSEYRSICSETPPFQNLLESYKTDIGHSDIYGRTLLSFAIQSYLSNTWNKLPVENLAKLLQLEQQVDTDYNSGCILALIRFDKSFVIYLRDSWSDSNKIGLQYYKYELEIDPVLDSQFLKENTYFIANLYACNRADEKIKKLVMNGIRLHAFDSGEAKCFVLVILQDVQILDELISCD